MCGGGGAGPAPARRLPYTLVQKGDQQKSRLYHKKQKNDVKPLTVAGARPHETPQQLWLQDNTKYKLEKLKKYL